MTDRKFHIGDRVQRDDGVTGTVIHTEFYRSNAIPDAPFWVRVKWDRTNSVSERVEDGLALVEGATA